MREGMNNPAVWMPGVRPRVVFIFATRGDWIVAVELIANSDRGFESRPRGCELDPGGDQIKSPAEPPRSLRSRSESPQARTLRRTSRC